MPLADFQTLVDRFTRDPSGLVTDDDRDQAIELATIRYSTDRPRKILAMVTADAAMVALPAGWEDGFSTLLEVSRPSGTDGPVAAEVVDTIDGPRLYFCEAVTGDVVVQFTVRHAVDALADTVTIRDREAVCRWAAGILLDQLSSARAGDQETTLDADSVDHNSVSAEYAARARAMRQAYYDHLSIDPKRTTPAATIVDLDLRDSRGRDRLIHRGGYR
ncbi:MAG: hypothetical protein RLO01_12665 [Thalassobaculaceae bacterium]